MPLTERIIPETIMETLLIYRVSTGSSLDSSGDYVSSPDTLIDTVIGCIEPYSIESETKNKESSIIENVDNITDVAFFRNVITSVVKEKDYIISESGLKYDIVKIHRWKNMPPEMDLKIITDIDSL